MNKNKKLKNPKFIMIGVVALVLALVGAGVAFGLHDSQSPAQTTDTPAAKTDSNESINMAPPTTEDAQRVEDNKQAIVNNSKSSPSPSPATTDKKSVTPVITYADQNNTQVEIGSIVQGVLENGGVCTATFTKGSLSFAKESQGVAGTSYVNCPAITANVSEFKEKGTWNIVVTYNSSTASGTSDNKQVQVN